MPDGLIAPLLVVFAVAVSWILWVVVLYPLGMLALSRLRPRRLRTVGGYEPTVAFVMAAYNEEKVIADRLDNYEQLDYPREKLSFLIGSDASTDATDSTISAYAARNGSIRLRRFDKCGKTRIVYELAASTDADIVVFTDADVLLDPDAVARMVSCFSDPQVGGVIGRMVYTDADRNSGNRGQKRYVEFENGLRRSESLVWTTVGPRGECFAVRRGAYTPLRDYRLSDDLNLAITIPLNGLRVWYEPSVVVRETGRRSLRTEYQRRLRMGQQAAATLLAFRETRKPWSSWLALELWSHKLMRILIGIPLLMAIVTAIPLAFVHPAFVVVAACSAVWILAMAAGYVAERVAVHLPVLQYPLYFTTMLISLTIGSVNGILHGGLAQWTSNRVE